MLANQNGLSGKYVSERHHFASQVKLTAGEAAKFLSKELRTKISAKNLVAGYKTLKGQEPEWHHSGFYKSQSGSKKTMGRTFFFSDPEIEELKNRWKEIVLAQIIKAGENEIKEKTIITGFFYYWDFDYSGKNGRKTNHKVLGTFHGLECNAPKNFTPCSAEEFECAKLFEGRKYYGWEEPSK